MDDIFYTFTDETKNMISGTIPIAKKIWGELDFNIKVSAGNYAAYGHYMGRYHTASKVIELPTNESFAAVKMTPDGYAVCDEDILVGLILHELGHHVERVQDPELWEHLNAGYTTHSRPSWCWVCAKGWHYYYPDLAITPEELAQGIKLDLRLTNGDRFVNKELSHFMPNYSPEKFITKLRKDLNRKSKKTCGHCNEFYTPKRSTSHFCSDKCRVASHRQKKVA